MTLVAFDTSTTATVVGVEHEGEVCALRLEAPPDSHPAHSAQLLGALNDLVNEAGSSWADVDTIGVGVGPGTFTGLRIAAAAAEGLRRARRAAVVPVGSLAALALPARERWPSRPVCAGIDARRGEVFAAGWGPGGAGGFGARAVSPDGLRELLGDAGGDWVVVGELPEEFDATLAVAEIERPAATDPLNLIDGRSLCELAREGRPVTGPVAPDYLREPDARPRAG